MIKTLLEETPVLLWWILKLTIHNIVGNYSKRSVYFYTG